MPLRQWLKTNLSTCSLSEEAEGYLLGRGVSPRIIEEWGLVTWEAPTEPCPDPVMSSRLGSFWEHLEGRILFPLYSPRGMLAGFDCRSPGQKDIFRYLLPDSELWPIWVGMPYLMEALWRLRVVIIAEGFFDVVALHHVTRAPVLGSGPAHLTKAQMEFLVRLGCEVHMVYDMDSVGRKGSEHVRRELERQGVSCYVHSYGLDGDDPGRVWSRGGRDLLQHVFSELRDLHEYLESRQRCDRPGGQTH